MNWLVKEEPENYSYSQFVDGSHHGLGRRQEPGRATQPARNEERRPRVLLPHGKREGDHRHGHGLEDGLSRSERQAGSLVVVELAAGKPLKRPVTLAEIKADKRFSDMPLVRIARLSVQPVTDDQWELIEEMSKR